MNAATATGFEAVETWLVLEGITLRAFMRPDVRRWSLANTLSRRSESRLSGG